VKWVPALLYHHRGIELVSIGDQDYLIEDAGLMYPLYGIVGYSTVATGDHLCDRTARDATEENDYTCLRHLSNIPRHCQAPYRDGSC
jgi:hypothetical protein